MNVGSDHRLLLGKFKLNPNTRKNKVSKIHVQLTNIELMWYITIKQLYQNRPKEKIDKNPIVGNEDVSNSRKKLRENITEAATGALRTWNVRQQKQIPNKTPWLCNDIKEQCKNKRKANLQYMSP